MKTYNSIPNVTKRLFIKSLNFPFILTILICLCLTPVLVFLVSRIHATTYVWQCTTLATIIRPVVRKSCSHIDGRTIPARDLIGTSGRKLRIGILMTHNKEYGMGSDEIVSKIAKNRERYCEMHGYDLIRVSNAETTWESGYERSPAWKKLTAIKEHLVSKKYDYVLYVDMDMVIMNPNIRLESLITSSNKDFILTEDWSGINTGIMIVKNTKFAKWFLQTAYDQKALLTRFAVNGNAHPFRYEQRAFHFLLDTKIWQDRKLPRYGGNVSDIRSHFHILPQCSMNSFVLHPLEFRGNREVSHYVESDFMVHMAGKKGQIKSDMLNYYLDVASSTFPVR